MTNEIEAYPLHWPQGWKRINNPKKSIFKTNFGRGRDLLLAEIRRLGGQNIILSTNIPLRRDGLPYANFAPIEDKGVAVYFTYQSKSMCFACDRWDKIEDNVWAICKSIEAIRGIERWGASDMIEKAFTGFTALPSFSEQTEWWKILDVNQNSTLQEIKSARNKLAKKYHPDTGNEQSHEMMTKINLAYEKAKLLFK